jgi:hypothetical protein
MKVLKPWLPLILIVSGLLLSGAKSGALEQKWNNQKHSEESSQQNETTQNQEDVSPAFYAAILGELRAIVSQEHAARVQQHADAKDGGMFWATIGLIIVGFGYIFVG